MFSVCLKTQSFVRRNMTKAVHIGSLLKSCNRNPKRDFILAESFLAASNMARAQHPLHWILAFISSLALEGNERQIFVLISFTQDSEFILFFCQSFDEIKSAAQELHAKRWQSELSVGKQAEETNIQIIDNNNTQITGKQSKAQMPCQHFLQRKSILQHLQSKTEYLMSPPPQRSIKGPSPLWQSDDHSPSDTTVTVWPNLTIS